MQPAVRRQRVRQPQIVVSHQQRAVDQGDPTEAEVHSSDGRTSGDGCRNGREADDRHRHTAHDATMNTATAHRPHALVGVVTDAQTYRNIGYLLVGLPLGMLWFSVLVTALSVGVSMMVVALLGIPILLGTWFVIRAFANVERATANSLLATDIAMASFASPTGNLWVRLKTMTGDRARRREAAFLFLRFPAGIAIFAAAVAAIAHRWPSATPRSPPVSTTSPSATGPGAPGWKTSPAHRGRGCWSSSAPACWWRHSTCSTRWPERAPAGCRARSATDRQRTAVKL